MNTKLIQNKKEIVEKNIFFFTFSLILEDSLLNCLHAYFKRFVSIQVSPMKTKKMGVFFSITLFACLYALKIYYFLRILSRKEISSLFK